MRPSAGANNAHATSTGLLETGDSARHMDEPFWAGGTGVADAACVGSTVALRVMGLDREGGIAVS